jgi:transcriptional regulator with XRE-family HTH domain
MAQTTLNSYLSGKRKPSIELIKRICANYQVSADWLLGLTDDRGGASGRGGDAEKAEYHKKLLDLEAENISLKGEVRGLQFALESALKGAHPAQASVSHSRPA